MSFLEIKGLRKRFGPLEVLKGIDLTLDKGGFLVLIGPRVAASRPSSAPSRAWNPSVPARFASKVSRSMICTRRSATSRWFFNPTRFIPT